ncbi:MAG: BamA/TamA family outer membrane protein [Vicinamibacterales bacterium]
MDGMVSPARVRRHRAMMLVSLLALWPAVGLAAEPQGPTEPSPVRDEAAGFLPEPRIIARAIDVAVRTMGSGSAERKEGFYAELGGMITGAGWISLGPGYRQWLLHDNLWADVSAGYSWRGYKSARATLEAPSLLKSRLSLGTQYRWQDFAQITYFGSGPESSEDARSEFRLRSQDVAVYAQLRLTRLLSLRGQTGWLQHPALLPPGGHFQRGFPSALEQFPMDPAVVREVQPNYWYQGLTVAADTRDTPGHPVRGGLYRAAVAHYDDRNGGAFSFRRYDVEAAHFLPLASERVVLALHGWMVTSDAAAGQPVPFYLMPSLGGHNTLRSFVDYRFHDRNMLVVNADARVALFTHVDVAAFVDAGNVSSHVTTLDLAQRSYGVGLRMHSTQATFARVDVAHGHEGWRVVFRLNDPLQLSRRAARSAVAPFVP